MNALKVASLYELSGAGAIAGANFKNGDLGRESFMVGVKRGKQDVKETLPALAARK